METIQKKYTIFKKLTSKILTLENKETKLPSYEYYLSERDFARHPEISFSLVEETVKEIEKESSGKLKVLWSGKTHRDLIITDRNSTIVRDINSGIFYKAIKLKHTAELGIPKVKIYFDPMFNAGTINGVPFKIKPEKPASKIFKGLYGMMNVQVDRQSNLDNGGYIQKEDPSEGIVNETYFLNDCVKSIRRTLRLGPNVGRHVVRNNGGTLLLVGEKLRKPELTNLHQK